MKKEYSVFSSGPIDQWEDEGYVEIKNFSEHLIGKIRSYPKTNINFPETWRTIISMIVWAFSENLNVLDLDLRSNEIYIKIIVNESNCYTDGGLSIYLFFKADNNGTTYMVSPRKHYCKCELPKHGYGQEWELLNGTEGEKENLKNSRCYECSK